MHWHWFDYLGLGFLLAIGLELTHRFMSSQPHREPRHQKERDEE